MVIQWSLLSNMFIWFSTFMKWISQLKAFFVIPTAPHQRCMKMDSPKSPLETAWHTLFALTFSHIGLLFNDQGIWITEWEKVGGRGKCYIALLTNCCPYLGTLWPKLQSLKGNKDERRRTMTVWGQMLTQCSSQPSELARLYFWPHHKRVGETAPNRSSLPLMKRQTSDQSTSVVYEIQKSTRLNII